MGAFQANAFQNDAFQVPGVTERIAARNYIRRYLNDLAVADTSTHSVSVSHVVVKPTFII